MEKVRSVMASLSPGSRPIHYPESDGRPLAETEVHLQQIFDLYASLRHHFRERPEVHINSNLLLYYVEGDPGQRVAPDVMVTFGIAPGHRRVFKTWVEGKAPEVVFEVTSASSRLEDRGSKKEVYAMLGVAEYYLYDPTGDYLKPPFRAYRLHGDDYVEVVERPLVSRVLGLELRVIEGWLRLLDPATERLVPLMDDLVLQAREAWESAEQAKQELQRALDEMRQTQDQMRQAEDARRQAQDQMRQAEDARRQAQDQMRQAEDARRQAQDEARQAQDEARQAVQQAQGRAAVAEAEAARLREELERLRSRGD